MTRRRRSALLWGGALAVGALILFTLGYFPQDIVRRQVERRLQEALGPGSSIRRMHVVPGRLSTDVYGLVIEGPTYRLTAPRARLVLAPGFLWGGSLEFRTVELEQPVLELWEGPPTEKRPPVDRRLVIGNLHVAGGSVVYRSGAQGTFVIRNVALDGSVGSGTVTIGASGGEWRRDPTVTLGPLAGVARLSSSLDIAIESLTATVAGSKVRISGSLGRAGDLKPDLAVEADVELADLGLFGAPGIRGRGAVKGTVRGLGDDLAIEGDVDAEDVRVAGWPIDRLQGRIERTAGPRGRTFADVTATLLGGRAEGKVELVRGGALDADITLQSIRTARLRAQGIDLGVPFDGLVSGRVTLKGTTDSAAVEADLTASGTGAGRRMTAALDASGRASVDRRSVDVRYALTLDAGGAGGGTPRIDDIHLVARGTAAGALPPVIAGTYEGHVVLATTGGPERVPVSGRFRTARGATTFTLAARALGGTLDASGDLRGSVARRLVATGRSIDLRRLHGAAGGEMSFRLDASGALDRLTGDAELDVADLTWNGGRIGSVAARVVGTAGSGRVTLAIPELSAAGQGTFDRRALRATLRLDQTPLERLAALSPPPDPITGTTSGTVEMTVPFANPDAVVVHARLDALDVVRGRLAARAVRPFSARYEGRRLALEGLEMAGEGVTLAGDASFGLDPGAAVEGMIRFDLDLSRLPTREGFSVSGRAAGDVELTGTRTRPRAYGTVNVTAVEVRDADSVLLALADGQVDLAGDAANVPGLRAEVPGGFLELAGRVPLAELLPEPAARALGLEAAGPIQARLRFDVDLGRMTVRPPWHVDGRAQGDVELVGPRARPRAYGAITLTDVYAEHPAAPPLQIPDARIELNGDEAQIPGLRATIADGVLDVEGRIPMGALLSPAAALKVGVAPGGEADLKATLTGVQAATLLEIVNPDRPSRVRALLTGEARLLGTLTSWREAHGEVRLAAAEVTVQDLPIEVTPLVARLEAGRVDFDPLEIRARGGVFVADGSADLFARTIDVTGRGTLDLRTVSPFLEEAVLTGDAEVDIAVRGALDAPRPDGSVAVRNATLRLGVIRQPLTAIAGTLVIDQGLVRLDQVTAMLGGGPVRMQGTARWAGLGIADTQVTITGEGLGIRYPVARSGGRAGQLFEELKARVNADLTLTGRTGDFLLAGKVTAERSLYDSDIFLDEGLLPPDIPPAVEDEDGGSRLLQTVGLDVEVSTENPFLVRNNLAQLEAEGTLRLRGSMDEPAPFGRFDVRPGGKVFLQEREFAIQSGRIAWNGTTDPEIAITGTTVIGQPDGDYQITVVANGPLETPALTLRSTPALSEREIASLIATGRTDVALNSGAWVVGEQAAALLAGRFTRAVAKELLDLGLDQVDIQPELLAREGEPSARFTFGKDFGRTLRLIYSTSLADPELQYYQALFRFREGMELSAKLQRRFDGTFTYSLGQRLRFGGSGAPPREAREFEQVELTAVTVEGGLRDFPAAVAEASAKPGSKITYWDLLDDADRIREELVRQGHIEAVIDARLDGTQAVFGGDVGPRYRWRVEGMASPPSLAADIEAALFEEEAVERGRERLLADLRAAGHLRASVEASSVPENGYRTLVFRVEPGPVMQADVVFPGATLLTPAELTDAAGGAATLLTRPRDAERAIRAAYREKHRLAAKIGPVQTAEQPGRVTVTVPVDEGPAARIAEVEYRGSTLQRATLDSLSRIAVGSEYDPVATSAGLRNIRDQYLTKGFPAVRVVSRLEPMGTDLRLVYLVTEGPRVLVGNVEIVGLRRTRRSLVEKQIDLPPGEPLDTRKLALLERRLSELGIFRRVVVSALPGTPATIRVEVEEDSRFLAAYDLRYNSEENFTGLVDGEMRNVLGLGVAVGGRIRAGRDLREFRASVTAPSFLWGGDDLTASAYHLSEFQRVALELPPTVGDLTKISFQPAPLARLNAEGRRRELGFQAQQAVHIAHPWDLLYGYRFKRTTCPGQGIPPLSRDRDRRQLYDPCETPLIRVGGDFSQVPDKTVDISGLDSSVVRDTRDAPLNPTRGTFLSLNVLAAPHFLGSDFDFTREFAHFSLIRKLGRSSFAWAHGYRVGLIQVYDKQRLPFDDLFKTGGPNTIRGYEIDTVGPLGPRNEALGGEALIVVNQELRYQHDRSGLGGAVFYDVGNVFAKARDIDFDFLHSAGVGVRYSSPFGLLRLDVAFPLKQRPGDRWYQINFGLGQAF